MRDTGFRPSPALRDRIAPADVEGGELRWGEVQDPPPIAWAASPGTRALFATADDLARFAQMLLNGGEQRPRILKPSPSRS